MKAHDDLLTIRQALEVVPVSKSLLYQLVADRVIPSVRIGGAGSSRGRILVRRSDLEKFIKQSRDGSTS